MPAVLVHGNPETPAVWSRLVPALDRTDVVLLHLPGFGCPLPDGFVPTKEAYADWLTGEVQRLAADGPVDLVGHDWGGALTARVASCRPELLRSWVCDILGVFHEEYRWHDVARIWQTPGDGERYFEEFLAAPRADQLALYGALGIPEDVGSGFLDATDATMAACVLGLYRSAAQPAMVAWGGDLARASQVPGLCLSATADPFAGGPDLAGPVAARLGARVAVLEGQGHWWMLDDPTAGAEALTAFWAGI